MKKIRSGLTVAALVCMLTAGTLQVGAAQPAYVCPQGNEVCVQSGYCVYGECENAVYICPNGNAACVEAGHCIYGVCRGGTCTSAGHGHAVYAQKTNTARGHGRGGCHR